MSTLIMRYAFGKLVHAFQSEMPSTVGMGPVAGGADTISCFQRVGAEVRPLVAVVGDNAKTPGGANEVIENIRKTLEPDFRVEEEYVRTDLGLPIISSAWLSILHIRCIQSKRFRHYDAVITVHPFSHHLKHRRHFYYILHLNRLFYDLSVPLLRRSKFVVRLALALNIPIVRLLDRTLLSTRLAHANAVVLSRNVRRQLGKPLDIIYPGGYLDAAELQPT